MAKTTPLKREKVLVTERPGAPRDKAVLETPAGAADVQVVTWPLWKQVAVRAGRTYIQSLVTFILAGASSASVRQGLEFTVEATGISMPANEFLALFLSAASLSMGPAILAFLQNVVEILAKLDSTMPRLRA